MRVSFVHLALFLLGITSSQAKRYNILFLISDDLNTNVGALGNEIAVTPNIDRLYSRGVGFTNMHVGKSDCAPSRLSLFTGRRIDALRVWDFEPQFRSRNLNLKTFPMVLKENGYTTFSLGKVFDPRSFKRREREDLCVGKRAQIGACSWDRVINSDMLLKKASSFCGVKKAYIYPSNKRVRRKKYTAASFRESDSKYSHDTCLTTLAIETLQVLGRKYAESLGNGEEEERPFFLAVGYESPHLPWIYPESMESHFATVSQETFFAPIADILSSDFFVTQSSLYSRTNNHELSQYSIGLEPYARMKSYYASVAYLDQQIGRLVDAFDALQSEIKDNTIVVFWSDNGFHLGDHGTWAKKSVYDAATKVPFVVVPPAHFLAQPSNSRVLSGQLTDALVQECDIFPTLLDMTQLTDSSAEPRSGTSLLPIMRRSTSYVRAAALSQYWAHNTRRKRMHMGYSFRSHRYRYIVYLDFQKFPRNDGIQYNYDNIVTKRELYDYAKDGAFERINRAKVASYEPIIEKFDEIVRENLDRDWTSLIGKRPFDL